MKNTKAGFSLIEAVIAIVLIAIAAITALSFIVYCNRFALQADARITAANFARETVESLYKRDYRDRNFQINPPATTVTYYDTLSGTALSGAAFDNEFISRHSGADRPYTITDIDSDQDGANDYKLITVRVTWP